MKKILCAVLVLLLTGCSASTSEPIDISDKYIKPINEVSFYNELKKETKDKLDFVYGGDKVNNNLIEMIGKVLTSQELEDINGNKVYFEDLQKKNIVLEVVQESCEHCLKQVPLTESILESDEDAVFVQFFAFGEKEEIEDFYERAKTEINDKLIIIPENDEMRDYVKKVGVDSTPTFIFFNHGVCTFACSGDLSLPKYNRAKKLAFQDSISRDDLVNEEGISVFDLGRDYNDVLNDLSFESRDKLAKIENSEQLTIDVLGQYVKFNELYEKDENEPMYEIETFTKYVNKPLIIFYVGYIKDNIDKDVAVINTFAEKHPEINLLTILMDTKDVQTSNKYAELGLKLETDVISSNAEIPQQLLDTKVYTYPAALFIQENTFVGGCHSIDNPDTIERAYETFIGEDSIAIIDNN